MQLGESRLQARQGLDGEVLGQRGVTRDELPGCQLADVPQCWVSWRAGAGASRLISLASQHDLAGGAAGLEELVGLGRLGQGQRRLEMDAELPGIDQSG